MNGKLIIFGIAFVVLQALISSRVFVTYAEMTNYAASKDAMKQVSEQLARIENKLDKLILGY